MPKRQLANSSTARDYSEDAAKNNGKNLKTPSSHIYNPLGKSNDDRLDRLKSK